jgi:excisionase family DNA binding protein
MHLSIKQAARFLNESDSKVRGYIASGRLSVERKGRQILIPRAQLADLLETEDGSEDTIARISPEDSASERTLRETLEAVGNRLAAVEAQIVEGRQTASEIQRLQDLLLEHGRQIADKDLEIEKLRRDLVYQKRLCEKELEDRRLALEEKRALIAKEAAEKVAREREILEQRLVQEQRIWSERLAQEQENFARKLTEMRDGEGFWARLMRMITWS